ncbi:MAG TPA: transglycosylase SLT domain-containing protein [Casimicrobiaceae bacterium]|nr:transglycosylase SLT domain-containing protein [Casimicrobiaceae bacterium]
MHGSIPKALRRTALAFAAAVCSAVHAQPSDADFAAARDAFRAGDSARLERIAPQLKGHVLEAYVEYWRLRLKLDEADPESVRAFLRQYADMPLAGRLRDEWLKALGKKGAWDVFAAEYRAGGDDPELACYAAQLRLARDGAGADVSEARRFWFSGHEQPESCQPVFAALLAHGALAPSDVWARFRLAHEAGNFRLAERIASELPPVERPAAREFQRIDRSARAVLAKGEFRWSSITGRELALYALDRVAQSDAAAAHEGWGRWAAKLPRADRPYGSLLVAYHAATQLLPTASDWYREADDAPQTESQRAWRVRAALRVGAWSEVARAIDSMPPTEALDPAWRYWKARALAAAGQEDDATRLYGGLATEHSFYGLLAAEALGERVTPVSEPLTPEPAALAAFAAQPAVQRVLKLSALDLRPEAQREWIEVVRGLSDDGLLLAASFAQSNGLYDRSINTAERTRLRHDFALRYPTPFRPELEAAARDSDLDAALVYGLVRQESRFVTDIVSASGAVGLMQLMPATARWVANRIGTDDRSLSLRDPSGNARLGAYYLRYVLDKLGGMPLLAAAAYNAGPKRAEAWRGAVPLEGAIYAETIPFTETRDYVKKVLANAVFYQARLGLRYVALKDRLGVVPPRGAERENAPDDGTSASPAIAGSDRRP